MVNSLEMLRNPDVLHTVFLDPDFREHFEIVVEKSMKMLQDVIDLRTLGYSESLKETQVAPDPDPAIHDVIDYPQQLSNDNEDEFNQEEVAGLESGSTFEIPQPKHPLGQFESSNARETMSLSFLHPQKSSR